jgi:MFS family permease
MSEVRPVPEPEEVPTSGKGNHTYAVLRNRDFMLYLAGRFISSFAQQMLAVTVGWEIYERTRSKLDLGLVGLVQMAPMFLCVLHAGHLADNHNRKKIMLWMQLLFGVACAGLTCVSYFNARVRWMFACLFVIGVARTYIWPASASFMPALVPRHQFAKAVTWNTASFQISAVAGPIAGGLLVAFTHGAVWVYAANTVAAIICAAMIGIIRTHHSVAVKERMSLKSVAVGLKFVYQNKIILGSITLDLFAVLLGGASALLPVYAKDILKVDAKGLGWLQAALPVGSLLMSLILVHRPPLQKAGRTLLWAVVGFGLATIGFGLSTTFWLSFLMLFVCGVTDYISVVVRHTLVQLLTPDEMRGRVSAVNSLFIGTSNQMGEFESGIVAQLWGPIFAVVSGGVGTIVVVALAARAWPELRKYGRLDA